MLARFGRLVELQARSIVSETLDAMKELLVARRALVKDRAAALNRDQAELCGNLGDDGLRKAAYRGW